MPGPHNIIGRLGLAAVWSIVATLLVLAFAALTVGVALIGLRVAGSELGEVQRTLWIAVGRAVGLTALAPLAAITVVGWWLASTARPGLDASWRSISLGILTFSALGFPPVGAWSFTIWTAGTPLDYVATLLLVAGGVSIALLLARRIVPALGPGAFARPRRAQAAPPDA